LLALSLGIKLLVNEAPPATDAGLFDRTAVAMLAAGGFVASVETRPFGSLLHGAKGGCRLILAESDPHGTFDQRLGELAAPVGPLRVAWRGRIYPRTPKTTALLRFYVWRELRRVGIPLPREPLAAWAASPGCDTSRIDWRRLAALPA
jgi:hypothetical protein